MAKNARLIDLTGQRFGLWIVSNQAGNTPRGGAVWNCACDCGTERPVIGTDLRNGKSKNCGCASVGRLGDLARKHGKTGTRLYTTWKNMRGRCRNPKRPNFANYGGRGITICAEWDSFATFEKWALASGYRDDLTIERVDVNGNYEPGNCTWVGADIQAANRRFVLRTEGGELWLHKARANGITPSAFAWRIGEGWPLDLAVTWPLGKRRTQRARTPDGKFA